MQRLVWIVAAICIAIWSLLAWFGHAVLGWVEDFTASNAGQLTASSELADWLAWAAGFLGAAGGALIVIIWLFGSAIIAVVAFGISRLVRRHEERQAGHHGMAPPRHR